MAEPTDRVDVTSDQPGTIVALSRFAGIAIALVATERWIAQSPGFLALPGNLGAIAVTFDLAVGAPLLYWWLLVRRSRLSAVTIVPVIALGLAASMALLPATRQAVAEWWRFALIPVELVLVWWGVRRARAAMAAARTATAAAGAGADTFVAMRRVLREVVRVRFVADVVAFELALLYYAFLSWRASPHVPTGARAFSTHRNSGVVALLIMGAVVALVETAVVHILVQRWSPTFAWALSILSVYGVVWIVGFLQALRLRPILVTPSALVIRVGLLSAVKLPWGSIARIVPAAFPHPDRETPGYLHAMVTGDPQFLIELSRSIRAEGVYGRSRDVRMVGVAVDEPAEFRRSIEAAVASRGA